MVVLFGGAEGTAEQAQIARHFEIPIVPLAFTGGTAKWYWTQTRDLIARAKPQDIEIYDRLVAENQRVALAAAVRLIGRWLNIPAPRVR
ncbi:hypothetical protein [Nocardia panacis]|uniref:hypothetical protein n=1 Tax=Nocardia panacis TaxID=2340916 RepID=UPI0011C423E3|nr:hypothetical protein [Nocardia panacis]